jgi:hypothetical protein
LIRCSGAQFDPLVVQAFTQVPLDVWRELRQLSIEPACAVRDQKTGVELRYSALAVSGDQIASGWTR